jgi:cell division septation protein DedD
MPPVAVEAPPVSAASPKAASAAPAPPVPVTASAPAGKFRLQVAAVRSRDEAERLASSVMKHQGVGGVQPEIDETVLGSMGTFYRVRLGPYADAAEPGQLCKSLRPQGFDCLVVTQ